MSEKISKILLAIEMIIICLPLTILFVFAVAPSLLYFYPSVVGYDLLTILIILFSLISAWYLIVVFIFKGRCNLLNLSKAWWIFPAVSSVICLFSSARLYFINTLEPSSINAFIWGLPLLIPLFHLLAEIYFRKQ